MLLYYGLSPRFGLVALAVVVLVALRLLPKAWIASKHWM